MITEDFTQKHPDVFSDFKDKAWDRIQPMDQAERAKRTLEDVCDHLIGELRALQPGPDDASRYHRAVTAILDLIFYPDLIYPETEEKLHGGRKRIDITFDNAAKDGFFWSLSKNKGIPCQYIMIECKNISKDPNNPELDQLSGRFSVNRGQFGIMACREIKNLELFIQRCADTYKDQRGSIVPLTDLDLIEILSDFKRNETDSRDRILSERLRKVAFK